MNLNVNALSTVIAVALQQVAQSQVSPQAATQQQVLSGNVSLSQVTSKDQSINEKKENVAAHPKSLHK